MPRLTLAQCHNQCMCRYCSTWSRATRVSSNASEATHSSETSCSTEKHSTSPQRRLMARRDTAGCSDHLIFWICSRSKVWPSLGHYPLTTKYTAWATAWNFSASLPRTVVSTIWMTIWSFLCCSWPMQSTKEQSKIPNSIVAISALQIAHVASTKRITLPCFFSCKTLDCRIVWISRWNYYPRRRG